MIFFSEFSKFIANSHQNFTYADILEEFEEKKRNKDSSSFTAILKSILLSRLPQCCPEIVKYAGRRAKVFKTKFDLIIKARSKNANHFATTSNATWLQSQFVCCHVCPVVPGMF